MPSCNWKYLTQTLSFLKNVTFSIKITYKDETMQVHMKTFLT